MGRIGCPLCATSTATYGQHSGTFGTINRYYLEHLRRDHYRCRCGWVGIVPGQHVTRSPHHEGPVKIPSQPRRKVRLSDLKLGDRP